MQKIKICLIALLFIGTQIQAQSLVEVLEAHGAVMGFENLKNVKSTVIKGANHIGDRGAMPFTSYSEKPGKTYMESEMMGRSFVMVRNGEKGWMTDFRNGGIIEIGEGQRGQGQRPQGRRGQRGGAPGAKPDSTKAGQARRAPAGRGGGQRGGGMGMRGGMMGRAGVAANLGGVLFNWQEKQLDVALTASEDYEGTQVFVVKSIDTLENVTYSYIDQDSFVLLKETSVRNFGGNEMKSSRIFSNYEMIEDIAVAFNVESKREGGQGQGGRGGRGFGGGSSNQVIESIEFNVDIDPSRFEKPVQ